MEFLYRKEENKYRISKTTRIQTELMDVETPYGKMRNASNKTYSIINILIRYKFYKRRKNIINEK